MTQTEWILGRLKDGGHITQMDALNGCGCFRLASRINDLRNAGHDIVTEHRTLPNGKVIAAYFLKQKETATC